MKKTLKWAALASIITVPAMADSFPGAIPTILDNMENPLYMPKQGMVVSRFSAGLMGKITDGSHAHKVKNHDYKWEIPVIRIHEELGYGITDRWDAHFSILYTHDDDIGRTGLSDARIGTTYRLIAPTFDGFLWDIYADWRLAGIGEMRGQYNVNITNPDNSYFDYDNYSDGMWGFYAGTKFGYVWSDRWSTGLQFEYMRTFADDNNLIRVSGTTPAQTATLLSPMGVGLPQTISAKLDSKEEFIIGANNTYQFSDNWSMTNWFRFQHYADVHVDHVTTLMTTAGAQAMANNLKNTNLKNGWDDYVIGISFANQVTDHAQVALFGEYTFDDANYNSQNGTDFKLELGIRTNIRF